MPLDFEVYVSFSSETVCVDFSRASAGPSTSSREEYRYPTPPGGWPRAPATPAMRLAAFAEDGRGGDDAARAVGGSDRRPSGSAGEGAARSAGLRRGAGPPARLDPESSAGEVAAPPARRP